MEGERRVRSRSEPFDLESDGSEPGYQDAQTAHPLCAVTERNKEEAHHASFILASPGGTFIL